MTVKAKITGIGKDPDGPGRMLCTEDAATSFPVSDEFIAEHDPAAGDTYTEDKDGNPGLKKGKSKPAPPAEEPEDEEPPEITADDIVPDEKSEDSSISEDEESSKSTDDTANHDGQSEDSSSSDGEEATDEE